MTGLRAASGAAWLVSARLVARAVDLGTLLVLARLLTPKDFGVVAIAMTLVYIVEAVLELPVALVLIQVQAPTRAHYDTAFTLGLMRGAALALLLWAAAWPYAAVFDDSRLFALIVVLALAPMLRGCLSPRLADYARHLSYGREFAVQVSGKLVALVAAVLTAVIFHSYWALVVATVAGPATMVPMSYILAPYRPRIALAEWKTFRGFLGWLGAAQILSALSWQCDRLFLGKLVSRAELGQFTVADSLAVQPIQALLMPLSAPLFPALSRSRTDPGRVRTVYLAGLGSIVSLCLPVMVGLILLAHPIVELLLGGQWSSAALVVQLLTVASAVALLTSPMGALVMATGTTRLLFRRSAIELAIKLPLLVVGGYEYGLIGVACARILTEAAMMIVNLQIVRRLTGIAIQDQLSAYGRAIVALMAMTSVVLPCCRMLEGLHDKPAKVLALGAVTIIGAVVYGTAMVGVWAVSGRPYGPVTEIVRLATRMIRRERWISN